MVGHYNHGVPAVDFENNSNLKKYTVNQRPKGLVISKALCVLMAIGALLLAVLVGLLVFFFVPRGGAAHPTPLSKTSDCDDITGGDITGDQFLATNSNPALIAINGNDGAQDGSVMHHEVSERLPRSVEPTHYRLQIIPFLNNLTTAGGVTITLDVKSPTDEVMFHAKNLDIDSASIKVKSPKSSDPLKIKSQGYVEGERYKIVLEQPLEQNVMHTLEILFGGLLNNTLQGFYRSEYEEFENSTTRYLASTQFSPTDARRAFPCFDEPSFKANFSITIGRPENMTSISNMPLAKSYTDPLRPHFYWDDYETTPKMSTYLVAFVVSDLYATQGDSHSRDLKFWSRRKYMAQTGYAKFLAPRVLDFFEDYFTIKFPLPKIDIVAVPDFGFSAMENWGLITFRESSLLFNFRDSSMENKRSIATVLSHELAHQWFGNLVTPKWWNDLWLKEGFATYFKYLGLSYAEPSWNIQEEFVVSETIRAYSLDALEASRPISFDVANNKQIRQTFDELSYSKGACIIKMMHHFLGDEAFKQGLINFLRQYQYSNANQDDLFDILTTEAHRRGSLDPSVSVRDVMDSWTKKAGFPVVTAIRDRANRKLILSQKRFLLTSSREDNSTWWVPLSITTSDAPDFSNTRPFVWLKNEPMVTIDMNSTEWYLVNVNQTGYYIVNYDEENWRQLIQHIMDLPTATRAQLISDSMDLARANLLDYDIPLRLVAHMAIHDHEIMFVPTVTAFKKLEFLSDVLSTTSAFGLLEEFHSAIFKATYNLVVNNDDFFSPHYLTQSIRRAVLKWACRKSGSACAIRAQKMFRDWMDPAKAREVPPSMKDVVYCTAIRDGTDAEWNFAFQMYQISNSASEKNILLDALGCTTRRWLLSRYLHLLVENNTSIRIQDADRVFQSVVDNTAASDLAFNFLRTNWDQLLAHYGEGFNIISKMVKSLPRYMNTEFQLLELVRFRKEVKDNIGTASQAFSSSIEHAKGNVEWMKKNYHSVERWFNDHKYNYNIL